MQPPSSLIEQNRVSGERICGPDFFKVQREIRDKPTISTGIPHNWVYHGWVETLTSGIQYVYVIDDI